METFLYVFDQVVIGVMMAILALLAVLSAWCGAVKERQGWLFTLLAGAYACFFLGNLFTALHYLIADGYPLIFSAADLSYLGLYCFLIAISLGLVGSWTDQERQRAEKYRRVSRFGPVVVVLFHVVYVFIYPDILLNYLLYCIPLSFLAYYALLLFLVSRETREDKPSLFAYHRTVLLFLVVELLVFLSSSFGWWPVTSTLWLVLIFPVVRLYFTAKKGVGL